ncbi:hypothetical protein MTO96_046436, partial [Rhipicephalus appendiculatus]
DSQDDHLPLLPRHGSRAAIASDDHHAALEVATAMLWDMRRGLPANAVPPGAQPPGDSSSSATVWKAVKSPQSRHKDRSGEQHPPRPGAFCSVQAQLPPARATHNTRALRRLPLSSSAFLWRPFPDEMSTEYKILS